MNNPETNTTTLYRIENPNIPSNPDGITSHKNLVGQWFSPDLDYVSQYLPKSTQTFGRNSEVVDGAQLVVAQVPTDVLPKLDAFSHDTASKMDIEPGNYIIPRDGSIPMDTHPLDEVVDELRGNLNNFNKLTEAKRRIAVHLGAVALH